MKKIIVFLFCFSLSSCNQTVKSKQKCFGVVQGDIVFPGEGIPSDLKVCALDLMKNQLYSFKKRIVNPKTNLFCYSLSLPEGSYVLYAETSDFINANHNSITEKGYYTDFVKNKHYLDSVNSSHKPITIQIHCNDTLKEITVGDFWGN